MNPQNHVLYCVMYPYLDRKLRYWELNVIFCNYCILSYQARLQNT